MISFSKLIILYLAGVNLFTLLLFGIDKYKAKNSSKRISERSLFLTSFLGGAFGALLGMKLFRHKTRKSSFQVVMFFLILWNLVIYFVIVDQFFYDLTAFL